MGGSSYGIGLTTQHRTRLGLWYLRGCDRGGTSRVLVGYEEVPFQETCGKSINSVCGSVRGCSEKEEHGIAL